jgi:hypothetical protein
MYSGSSPPAWGQFKLPHQVNPSPSLPPSLSLTHVICYWIAFQIMSPVNSVGAPNPQMDFLSELHRAVQNAKASFEN